MSAHPPRPSRTVALAALAVVTLIAGLLVAQVPPVYATSTTVAASDDTYSRSQAPSTSFGTSPRWSVDGRSDRRFAFLMFEVPAPPSGERYTRATLRVHSDASASSGPGVRVYETVSSWREETLTWQNQPSRGAWVTGVRSYPAETWVELDVTSAVPTAGGTQSFRLQTREQAWLGFASRENRGGQGPQLVLETAGTAPSTPEPSTPEPSTPEPTTAAERLGWGTPVAGDEFDYTGAPDPARWNVYDSAGHAGNGLRRPSAWSVGSGVARVSGDAAGTTGGMSARFDRRRYGRWEARIRTSTRDPEYHPVLLLWPDAGDWPCGGEIDYAEGTADVTRMRFFQHYSCENRQTTAQQSVDMTQWHHFAVEWSPEAIVGYLDGQEWFRDTDPTHQPPRSMHQTIQLDWFPDGTATTPSWLEVDWVRVHDLDQGDAPTPTPTPTPTTDPSTPAPGDLRLAVIGDVNHEGNSSVTSREGRMAASVAAWDPGAVALVGDLQYQSGTCARLVEEFDRTGWGELMGRAIGAAGPTHDYTASPAGAADYSQHMEGTCPGQISGPSLSAQRWDRTIRPYEPHEVDLGAWTVISMPSGQWRSGYNEAFGAQWSGSALTSWLDTALAAATQRGDRAVVVTHEPYWSSGTDGHSESEGDAQLPWIKVLDRHDVPLLLSGHQHNYERFHPQDATGARDDAAGTQQLQVSSGGIGLRSFTTTAPNSAVRNDTSYGWLGLVLHADGSYDWRFTATEGTFTDSGSRSAAPPR